MRRLLPSRVRAEFCSKSNLRYYKRYRTHLVRGYTPAFSCVIVDGNDIGTLSHKQLLCIVPKF